MFLGLGFFLLGLMHWPLLRQSCTSLAVAGWDGLARP